MNYVYTYPYYIVYQVMNYDLCLLIIFTERMLYLVLTGLPWMILQIIKDNLLIIA